jgi:BlaI family penicillinase repressor
MTKEQKKLSALEWEIIGVVWQLGGRPSVRQVWQQAYPNKEKAYTTVQTVMNNIEEKGYLSKEKIGLVNFYRPIRQRDELLGRETHSFVKKVFEGSALSMVNYLIDSQNLNRQEIEALKKIIKEKENQLKGNSHD